MSKKHRKDAYRARPVLIPKLIRIESVADAKPIECAKLYAAIITMSERPTTAHCNNLSKQLAYIAACLFRLNGNKPVLQRKDESSIAIYSAIKTVEGIIDRTERTGTLAVTDTEKMSFKAAAGKLDEVLRRIPLLTCESCVREVEFMTQQMEQAA